MKTQAVNNKNNKPAEFLIKGPWWDNSVMWGALSALLSLHRISSTTTEEEETREGVGRDQWDAAGLPLWCHTPASPQKKKVLLNDATRGYGLHVSVGPEPAAGFRIWTEYFSIYVWVYLCVCLCVRFVCMFVDAECQGNPKPPSFSSCPFPTVLFSDVSVICLSLVRPSGFSEQTFWQKRSGGSVVLACVALKGPWISTNLTAKMSVTALPINR